MCDQHDSDTEPDTEIQELKNRVEQLEFSNDLNTSHVEILLEIIQIVTEFPAGKQIFNRAVNRQRLNTLRENVLPRRKKQLGELEAQVMPQEIKEDFEARELKLIQSALRAIGHRENFEERAQENISNILERFFAKFEPHQSRMIQNRPSLTHKQP